MQICIGTNNKVKSIEISEVLAHLPIAIVSPSELGIAADPEETGDTYEENALIKARFFNQTSGLPTIADDSGIVIEALEGELGIHTRRWGAGATATDEEWIEYFLKRMSHEENKRAHFICTIAYIDPEGTEHIFEGRCSGTITESLEADYLPGLPISACFRPDSQEAVFSALSIEQKNSTSHRGKATELLKQHLVSTLKHL